eukprot:1142832-Pelagomonas_calceolata.AAC.5
MLCTGGHGLYTTLWWVAKQIPGCLHAFHAESCSVAAQPLGDLASALHQGGPQSGFCFASKHFVLSLAVLLLSHLWPGNYTTVGPKCFSVSLISGNTMPIGSFDWACLRVCHGAARRPRLICYARVSYVAVRAFLNCVLALFQASLQYIASLTSVPCSSC